jgi:hypothetical protein
MDCGAILFVAGFAQIVSVAGKLVTRADGLETGARRVAGCAGGVTAGATTSLGTGTLMASRSAIASRIALENSSAWAFCSTAGRLMRLVSGRMRTVASAAATRTVESLFAPACSEDVASA